MFYIQYLVIDNIKWRIICLRSLLPSSHIMFTVRKLKDFQQCCSYSFRLCNGAAAPANWDSNVGFRLRGKWFSSEDRDLQSGSTTEEESVLSVCVTSRVYCIVSPPM